MKKLTFLLLISISIQYNLQSQTETSVNELYRWKLLDGILEEPEPFDSVIDYFQILNPIERISISNSWTGNTGGPWKSNEFLLQFDEERVDFIFDNNYRNYGFSKDDQYFYHSKTPYFDLNWTLSTKKRNENQVDALYTQNINKKWNVGVRYKLIATKGEFPKSKISAHSFNGFTSYSGEKYSMHAAFIRNKNKTEENGGVIDTISPDPEFAEPIMENALSVYFDRSFFISQQYKFGFTRKIVINDTTTESTFIELGRLNHVFSFDDNYRIYHESTDTSNHYYHNIYLDPTITTDSVRLAKIENSLYWTFKEIKRQNFNGRLTFGATLENLRWKNFGMTPKFDSINTTTGKNVFTSGDTSLVNEKYNNFKLMANLDARTKMFIFNVNGFYYLGNVFGNTNRADNFEGNLLISKGIILGKKQSDFYFKLKLTKNSPYLFENKYSSNHFEWDTSFSDLIKSEGRIGLSIPAIRLSGEFAYAITNNYIYFGADTLPHQYTNPFTVMSIRLKKDFKLGRFFIKNHIVYQLIPEDQKKIITLPDWIAYHSLYYDLDHFLEKYSIEAQVGYDLNFSSKYQAYGYNPAIGQFYLSDYRSTGYYPIINLFINMRIKTVLLSIKFEHFNNTIVFDKFYFPLDKYPINTTAFKVGVSWRFKN